MADIKDIIETLDTAADGFEKVVTKSQMQIYEEAVTLIKELETDNFGRIKQTIANLKKLNAIKAKLKKVATNDRYMAGLGKFVQYFDAIAKQQSAYFTHQFAESAIDSDTNKTKRSLIKQQAVDNTIAALSGDGLAANVTGKINDILVRAVTTGEKFADLTNELRDYLQGKDGGQGALARYASTYATTAISQFTGQNNKLITDGIDTDWFMYVGSTKETTREFCDCMVAKRYVHRSEFRKILSGNIDGHQCRIYDKTGLPLGMIAGTDETNFQVNCGGWNCRHQLVPVSELVVPKNIRDAFERGEVAGEIVSDVSVPSKDIQGAQFDIERPDDLTFEKLADLWKYLGRGVENLPNDFREFVSEVLGQDGNMTPGSPEWKERKRKDLERMKTLPTYARFRDLAWMVDTLGRAKNEDVAPIYRKEYNDAIARLQYTIQNKGVLMAEQDIRLCDNIRRLSKSATAIAFGLDKLSCKTPVSLLEELKKRGFDIGTTLPNRELFDKMAKFNYFVVKKPSNIDEKGTNFDAWHSPTYKYVCVQLHRGRYLTQEPVQQVIAHEFGHALDDGKKVHEEHWRSLYSKWVDKISVETAGNKIGAWMDKVDMNKPINKEYWHAVVDTLQCFMTKYAQILKYGGHDTDYMSKKANRMAELFAHASEFANMGNPCMQTCFPQLYRDLINAYKVSIK